MTKLALILHVIAGTIALFAGIVAMSSRNLVATAWLTVRRKERSVGVPEKIALLVVLCLCLPFAVLSFQLATGLEPSFKSATPFEGPVRVALYTFTLLTALAAIGDVRLIQAGGVTGVRRIGRHLWRMCFGFTLAVGSAFTTGLPRLLPETAHVPLILLFISQLSSLALMIFWMIRVRFTGWHKDLASN